MGRIIFYPSGDPEAGYGHITRCAALADELAASGHETVFACREEYGPTLDYIADLGQNVLKLTSTGSAVNDLTAVARLVGQARFTWLVADAYEIDSGALVSAESFADKVAVIDDLADRYLDCDLVLNQNLGFDEAYDVLTRPAVVKLLGPRYALLRKEFFEARGSSHPRDGLVRRVLVFMGGHDPQDNTGLVVKAMLSAGLEVQVDIVVGAEYRYINNLEATLGDAKIAVKIYRGVSAAMMAGLMSVADIAIGAAGSSSWERCCLGLPALLLVVADNQQKIAEELHACGAAIYAGRDGEVDVGCLSEQIKLLAGDRRKLMEMSEKAWALVDGCGARRVAEALIR